jgi:ABC-type spermidine/putrescine transport system permease subunit II
MAATLNMPQRALSTFSVLILAFLVVPILIIVPISLNSGA